MLIVQQMLFGITNSLR